MAISEESCLEAITANMEVEVSNLRDLLTQAKALTLTDGLKGEERIIILNLKLAIKYLDSYLHPTEYGTRAVE